MYGEDEFGLSAFGDIGDEGEGAPVGMMELEDELVLFPGRAIPDGSGLVVRLRPPVGRPQFQGED